MLDSRAAGIVSGVGLVLFSVTACASGQPSAQPDPSGSGECGFEVSNQTDRTLSVTAGGSRVRSLGTLGPGQSLRFQESCEVDEVVITARPAETAEPAVGPASRRSGDRVIQRSAPTRPGDVVRVPLRFPQQDGRNPGGIDGGRTPPGGWGGWDSVPPPG